MEEETRGLGARQVTHDHEILGSNSCWGDHFSCTIHLDQIMETNWITWHCCMCCNPSNERVDFEVGWHIYLYQGYKHFVGGKLTKTQSPMEEEKIIWGGECQVHRPLFTGRYRFPYWVRNSGQVPSLPISLHRSPFAGAKFTELPLQIPPNRQMAKKICLWWLWILNKFVIIIYLCYCPPFSRIPYPCFRLWIYSSKVFPLYNFDSI